MKFNDVVKVIKPGFYEGAMGKLIEIDEDFGSSIMYKVKLNNIELWFDKEYLEIVI